MKTSFLPRLVNGQVGDPALFVDILRQKRALLFDCGSLSVLTPGELLRIGDVFISHAHIDHFIGFDHLLRLHLGRGKRIRVYGPPGITACVRGKLSGYTWNLVRHQRLLFEVREWDGCRQLVTEFPCRQRFRPGPSRTLADSAILWEDDQISVQAALLDHKIPSLAFLVSEKDFYNVDPVRLKALGHRPDCWLNDLKRWMRQGSPAGVTVRIDGQPHDARQLADQLMIFTPGKKIGYVADTRPSQANLSAITALVRGADLLFSEGAFLHADEERAVETCHLTARWAGEAARLAGVNRLVVFHFSPKYEGRFDELEREAAEAFAGDKPADESKPSEP